MDVTSMLNANSGAVEQQMNHEGGKEEVSKTPTRNRTPWDAGGYSLPINTVSSTPSTPPHNSQYDDVQTFTPTSPRHKFSDSRSSLSSFASSLHSANHSRFSSMSTVGSSQPLNSLSESLCESLSPRSGGPRSQSLELSAVPELYRPSVSRTHSRGSLSPTDSLAALSINAKEALLRRQSEITLPQIIGGSPMSAIMEKDSGSITPPEERPCSPSDAILIRRPTLPSLRVLTSEQELNGSGQPVLSRHFLSAPLENNHHPRGKGHKRALSAPDFPAPTINNNLHLGGPRGQPTPPTSHHPDNASPVIMSEQAPVSGPTPPADATMDTVMDTNMAHSPPELKCMYVPDCQTGSQLRKAISHIFGRNKMCTRLIPEHVWVHFCRKHYQRSRYRNPTAYAELQCELVQKQIRRIHDWSEANKLSGSGGVVQNWTITMRKREQKRLDDLASGMKRPAASMDDDYDSEGYEQIQAGKLPPTAVPEWLIEKCGKGYTTAELADIFNILHEKVHSEKTFLSFPDIELLPNIVGHVEQPKATKGGVHKRTQSLGVASKPEYDNLESNVKRRRPNEKRVDEEYLLDTHPIAARSRFPETGRRIQIPHRPSPMGYIPENQVGELNNYSFSPQHYQASIASPSPQRFNGQLMTSRLETSNNYMTGHSAHRPSHVRSRSDIGAMRLQPEQVYNEGRADSYFPRMGNGEQARSFLRNTREESWHPYPQQHNFAPSDVRGEMRSAQRPTHTLPSLGHQRNHSTPMIPSSYIATNRIIRDPSEYASQTSRIIEDEQARNLFSARR